MSNHIIFHLFGRIFFLTAVPEFQTANCRKNGEYRYVGNDWFHLFALYTLFHDRFKALHVIAADSNEIGKMRFGKMYPFMRHYMIFFKSCQHHANMKTDDLFNFF